MRKSLLAATAILGLVFAPSVWAEQKGESGGGTAPGGGAQSQGGGAEPRDEMKGEQGRSGEPKGGKAGELRHEGDQKARQGADDTRGDEMRGDKAKGASDERGDKVKGAERARAPGGGAASLSTEQKTKVRSGFQGASIKDARDINITHVTIGASIPHNVVDYWEPVPASIIEVAPEWRAYRVVRIHGEFVVIDPDTFEVVYVM